MTNREKVINGIECCLDGLCECCPYNSSDGPGGCKDELMVDALSALKAQEPPANASILSAIECLLHPQDADDSDMSKAIDTAVRAMRLLRDQEPHVMTFREACRDIEIWYESIHGASGYGELYYDANAGLTMIYTPHGVNCVDEYAYGKKWRCWTSRPTNKQRKEAKWNG